MNWAQENKKLAGIVGIMVAGAVGLGAWLFFSWSGYAGSMERWESTQTRIAAIKGKKLEPTEANATAREKLLNEYADKVNGLRGVLLDVQQPVKPMSETEFQAKLKDRATAVKTLSRASGTMSPPLADDFALGFDKYAAQPPRSAEIAAELNVHLDVIEKLVTTCIEAGVTSIDMLERAKLANEDAPTPPKVAPAPAKKSSRSSSKTKAKKPVITEQAAAEPVLDRYPIKLMLTTDQGPLQSVMNTLAHPGKMPHFLVVRQLRIENTRLDGPSREEMNQKKSAATSTTGTEEPRAPEPPKPGAPVLILPPKPAAPDAYDIMGNEQLKVYLEVDYIRFRPAAEVEEEEAAAPAKP